ncbi:ABC transporter ATP-binding protein [Enterococcus sp. LJL98]
MDKKRKFVKERQNLRHFWALLKTEKLSFFVILFASTLSNVLLTAIPFLMGLAIDRLLQVLQLDVSGDTRLLFVKEAVWGPVMGLILIVPALSLLSYTSEFVMARVSESLVVTLREKVTDKLTRLPMAFFDTYQIGEIISRTTSDAKKVSDFLVMNVTQMLSSIVSLTLGLVMMFYLNGYLTLFVLLILLFSVFTTRWIANKNKLYAEESQASLGELSNIVEELYAGNGIIKTFNLQEQMQGKVAQANQAYAQQYLKSRFINFSIYPAIRFLNQLSFVFSALAGAVLVLRGSLSIGTIQAYLQYVNQISEPITNSSYVVNAAQNALTGIERIFEILEQPEEMEEPLSGAELVDPKGAIAFQQVSFGYTPEKTLMKAVDFTVQPQQMVAIVGPTGAGKTTLVNLLMRFYEVNQGTITFDGIPIQSLTRERLRRLFGMVLQDTWLFEGTIQENIAYGKPEATLEEVMAAAKAAQCDHFIRTLPEGYQTVITGEGSELSQGEQQLLTIARVLLVDPSVVILDEATSSVDTRTEMAVQKAMQAMLTGRTSFVIAHRLSTIVSADRIFVMNEGDIVEQGTHLELLARKGMYAQLYHSQF